MNRQTISECLDLPMYDICQKIYHLSSQFYIALIQLMISDISCQLHIKIVEKETKRSFCFDKILLLELTRQLKLFEKNIIEYPCSSGRNLGLGVKQTIIPGEYQVKFQSSKLILDGTAVKYLLASETMIFEQIITIENQMYESRDEIDL